ncbi:hypothetical protein JQ597_31725 [Bradyrhizobium sp. AUGA SZCCT0177]|uniref:hypothetical protein n=1 Tax=Bradyrhizobium sp. AUGA SZCCT0177 TaxID=2807665 RepID=UPI001BA84B4C|nr:hypothetical protein [Bradyrhizobium sp. AUGA SZCCT0177]MBR1286633.1 hypothetical protein [Bradyrhizobium sp. AUGA SZCCT0177]
MSAITTRSLGPIQAQKLSGLNIDTAIAGCRYKTLVTAYADAWEKRIACRWRCWGLVFIDAEGLTSVFDTSCGRTPQPRTYPIQLREMATPRGGT